MIPDGPYVIVQVLLEDVLVAVPDQVTPSLDVDGGRIGGNAGCNRFMGAIDDDGTIGPLATTMMACPPPVMEFEQLLLGLLERVNGSRVSGSGIYLVDDDLDLVRMSPAG